MAYTLAQLQAMGAKPNVAPQKSYTLAELQKMGAKPVAAAAPALPAPKPKAPVADLIPHFKYKQEDSTKPVKVVGKAILNIPHEAATHLTNIAKVPVEAYKTFTDPNVQANKGAAALGAAEGAWNAIGAPIVGGLTTLGRTIQGGVQQGVKSTTGFDIGDKAAAEAWNNKLPNTIAAVEGFQRGLVENPVATAAMTAEGVRVARGLPRGTDSISSMARPTIDVAKKAVSPVTKPIAAARQSQLIKKTAGEIAAVESNYAKGRKAAKYSKDAGAASRERVAKSAVLKDAVDADGKILTSQPGGAIEQYRKTYVAPKESVVRDLLVKEGGKALASEVEAYLLETVRKSNLTGKELTTALKNVKREMAGYKLKADAEGRIPLEVLHDAKINTTPKGNKFLTPPDVQAYNKTLGRGLKELVEKYSKEDIKGINSELAKYYEDLALLERLDGARVRGGKLGKYTSQITGNIAGGIAGSAFGPFGSAVGTVVGGEVSSAMKGAAMGRTFGGVTERVPMRSAILEKAAADAKAPRLALPEATSEFRSQIGSGPTIQLPAGEAPTSRVLPSKSGKGSETQLSPQSVTLPKNSTAGATTPGSIKPSTFATVDEMLKAAPEAKAFIDGRARQVAEQTGNRFIQAPNKSVESVTRKLNEADIMGDWNRINDVARDTIVLDNPGSLSAVIESVTKGLKEGEFRTKTQNPADYMGYEGTVINVRTPGGLNGEIQVTKPKMVYGKLPRAEAEALLGKAEVARIEKEVGVPPGLGHEIYEQIRTLSPMDEAKLNALKQQSIDYYAKLR